jgi:hypothetical protein
MKSNALAVQSAREMTENRAKRCQISGRSPFSVAKIGHEDPALHRGTVAMRKLWMLICVLGMPCVASAQNNHAAWENLSALQAGQKIQVVEMNSKKVSGRFVSVSDKAISLEEAAGQQTIQRQDVRSVKLMKREHLVRDALIGAGVGAGVGAAIGAASYSPCKPSQSFCIDPVGRGGAAGIVAVIGGVAGAVVGALVPNHKTIYRAKSQ